MELVLWNCFALSLICLIASYYKINKKDFSYKKKLTTRIVEVKPSIKKENNNRMLKNNKFVKEANLINVLNNFHILFIKKPHASVVNFITNLNLTQYFAEKNSPYITSQIYNNLDENIIKNREIILNYDNKNILIGKNFIRNNCVYFHKIFNKIYVTSKTVINPIHNVIITEVCIKNLSHKSINVNAIEKLQLSQISYQTKYDKVNHETSYIHENNFIINKTIANTKFQKFYSKVSQNNRTEIELNNFEIDGNEKIKMYFISAINVNLMNKITKQNIETTFVLNYKEYLQYAKNLSLLTKARIEHIIKKSNHFYANVLPYKQQLKNKNFYIQSIEEKVLINKKLYLENVLEEGLSQVRSLFLLTNYPVEVVLRKNLNNDGDNEHFYNLHTTNQQNILTALNINKPNYLLRNESEYKHSKYAIKLNNYFKTNFSKKWFSTVSYEENNVKIKNLKTNEATMLIKENCTKNNTKIFFKVNTKIEYINNLINKFLPKKIYKNFINSNESDLYQLTQKPNISFLKYYHYNYVIKLLIQSKQYIMLYKYLLHYVLGIQVIGDVIKMSKEHSSIGKFDVFVNGEHFTKFNHSKDYYFVYNNIIYHNVNLLKLNRNEKTIQLEILK